MSALDVRNNSAVMKRAEQLKRWEESDTNREASTPRPEKGRRIKFSSGCVFLAACLAGDKDEVVKLLDSGADINTANVDGLTALHQACIDDNLEMVEFLVEHGADINRQDNEGWTPLHATSSCGFVSIARYLVEHGADVAAVNSDGDLALDLAVDIQHLDMIDFMQKVVTEHNIDCEKARQAEEQQMLNDAKRWLRSDASEVDRPHPKTGATALHVAAAKGYTKVLSLLLAGRANVDKQDNDGWTPLHAAAHWGQKEAAEMLVDAMADMDIRNYAGQSCIDVAERKMVKFLEELRATKRMKRRPSSQISGRITDTIENHMENPATKIIRVEVRPDQLKDQTNDESKSKPAESINTQVQTQQSNKETNLSEEEAPWRRSNNAVPRTRSSQPESPTKNQVPDKDSKNNTTSTESSDVILRRTQSFENDEKFYQKYNELRARIKANSCPILPASLTNNNSSALGTVNTPLIQNYSVQRSASLKDHRNFRKPATTISTVTTSITTTTTITNTPITVAPTTTASTLQTNTVGSITITPTTVITTPVRRSFVPPVRDEESETQRKAHAKRVRETRRSTQGVTLDEIKSAEELVKKKNMTMNNNNNSSNGTNSDNGGSSNHNNNNNTNSNNNNNNTNNNNHSNDTPTTPTITTKTTSTITISTDASQLKQVEDQTPLPTTFTILAPPTITPTNIKSAVSTPAPTLLESAVSTPAPTLHEIEKPTHEEISRPQREGGSDGIFEKDDETKVTDDDENDDSVSATFTIVTPVARNRVLAKVEYEDADDVSTSFTMISRHESRSRTPTPTSETEAERETEIVVIPPEITIDAPQEDQEPNDKDLQEELNERKGNDDSKPAERHKISTVADSVGSNAERDSSSSSSPSLDSEETSSNNSKNNETDNLENITETAKPTMPESISQEEQEQRVVSAGKFSDSTESSKSEFLTQLPKTTAATTTPSMGSTISIIPALESPVRLRDKRSIFDLDNANSLTLAEKLRNEANKYSHEDRNFVTISDQIANASDSDRDSVFSNYSRRSLDSSPLHMSGCGGGGGVGVSGSGGNSAERRPSWRLKFDAGCKFKLEDASTGVTFPPTNSSTIIPSAPAVIAAANLSSSVGQRRINTVSNPIHSSTQSVNSIGRPVSAPSAVGTVTPVVTTAAETTSIDRINDSSSSIGSYSMRRFNMMTSTAPTQTSSSTSITSSATTSSSTVSVPTPAPFSKNGDDKENDKENDSRTSAATQAVLQRRRKPKRRSTGVVHLDMDELDPERQESNNDNQEKESGSERVSRSRLGSTASNATSTSADDKSRERSENGGDSIDYKALWEAVKLENEKLKQMLKKKEDEVVQSRTALERITNATTKNSLSEIEKRERRAMERKLSEMEEELKQLDVFKTENQRLKEENGALIRVISKLSK